MKCSSCQIEINDKSHYLQELHTLNTQRKLHDIPPLTTLPDNYKKNENTQDTIIDNSNTIVFACLICDKHYDNKESLEEHFYEHKPILDCLICNTTYTHIEDINKHMQEHSIEYGIYFVAIHKRKCIFCGVVIKDEYNYKNHIKKHNTAQLNVDGAYATLNNGRVIGNKEYVKYFNQTLRKVENAKSYKIQKVEENKKEAKIRNENKKNEVKISLAKNAQKYFRAHWLQ
ncbi:hypothetical protein BDAP_002299 [Binucleata daphniae]